MTISCKFIDVHGFKVFGTFDTIPNFFDNEVSHSFHAKMQHTISLTAHLQFMLALKDKFTQKWNCSHYLFTPVLMESQVKSCSILLNTWSRWRPWDSKLIWKDWIYTHFLATIFTATAYLKVLRRTLSEVRARARPRGLNITFSSQVGISGLLETCITKKLYGAILLFLLVAFTTLFCFKAPEMFFWTINLTLY